MEKESTQKHIFDISGDRDKVLLLVAAAFAAGRVYQQTSNELGVTSEEAKFIIGEYQRARSSYSADGDMSSLYETLGLI